MIAARRGHALYVEVQMNPGDATVDGVQRLIARVVRRAGQKPDVVYGNECSDRPDIKHAMAAMGYGIVEFPDEPGSPATPLFYLRSSMQLLESEWQRILARVWAGPGAGPSWLKPKGLNLAMLRHRASRRRKRATPWHAPASQQHERRWRLAKLAITRILGVFNWRVMESMGMDGNAKRGRQFNDLIERLVDAGWTCTDIAAGNWLATHGQNVYDLLCWKLSPLITFVEHFTVRFGSDHLAKVGVFEIRMTRKAARQARRRAHAHGHATKAGVL